MLPSFMGGSTVKTCTGIKVMCDCCFRVKHRVPHKPSNTKQYFWDVPVRYTDPNTAPMIFFCDNAYFFCMSIIMYGGAAFVQRNYTTELPSFAIPTEFETEIWVPHE